VGAVGVPNLASILIIGSVPHIMATVFDRPLIPSDLQELLTVVVGVWKRAEAADPQNGFLADLSAFQMQEVPMDSHHLVCRAEADLFGIDLQSPDRACLQPPMVFLEGLGLPRMIRGEKRPRTGAVPSLAPRVDCLSRKRNSQLLSPDAENARRLAGLAWHQR